MQLVLIATLIPGEPISTSSIDLHHLTLITTGSI